MSNLPLRVLCLLTLAAPFGCSGNIDDSAPLAGSICALPKDPGPCLAAMPAWYFDSTTERCEQFTYGGCEGNANNFATREDCEASCKVMGTKVEPVYCGGWNGQTCTSGEFCAFERDGCDFADASGVCEARPEACTEEFAPVCGCNGRSYSNLCAAQMDGVDAARSGTCEGPCDPQACGLAPGAPNYMCEDGSTGGPVCERVDGFCRWQNRECPASVSSCEDQSRDPIVVRAGFSFGKCAGKCVEELTVSPSPLDSADACDVVVLQRCEHGLRVCDVYTGTLTRQGHDEARQIASELVGVPLQEIYGCPDCADGGASHLTLMRDGVLTSHNYDFGGPPAVLRAADTFVAELIEDLSACRSSSRLQIDESCVPAN